MNLDDLSAYDYNLPEELIAQYPPKERGGSRLLVANRTDLTVCDKLFANIADILDDNYFLVMNDTQVIPARMPAKKMTGGKSEVFFLDIANDDDMNRCHALIRGKVKAGDTICVGDDVIMLEKQLNDGSWLIHSPISLQILMERHGKLPLPPYIGREPDQNDYNRYQTIYAVHKGSVAAPTAGLHFTQEMLDTLSQKGVESIFLTLHVGIGTFRPIKTDHLSEHQMHNEQYHIDSESAVRINALKAKGKKLVAVGTTSVRTLESATDKNGVVSAGDGNTNLFITPGYDFKVVDAMITNFHLPKSSLIVLVSSLMGFDFCKKTYNHAVNNRYRFFSYGDAMLIL